MKGYWGKLLRIYLSNYTYCYEDIPNSIMLNYLGGKGFGRKYMLDEIGHDIQPLDPRNKMFIFTGPAAGTYLPTTTRVSLHTLSPLTGVSIDSYCGGSFGIFIKKAGIDGLVIEGASPKPTLLRISENFVEFKDATHIWGMDCYKTEEIVKQEWNNHQARVLTIGPAGENLVSIASIGHDMHRHFGRGGSGAVMGSKKLKAIAINGSMRVDVEYPKDLKDYCKDLSKRIKNHPGTGHIYPVMGTPAGVDLTNTHGVFPSKYWEDGTVEHVNSINFPAIESNTLVKTTQCLGCPVRCAHINEVKDGPYKGISLDGPEFETIYAFGGLCNIKDIREVIKLNDVCDRAGIDTISAGNLVGFMMYGTEKGSIPERYHIKYGDTEASIQLLEDIAHRRRAGEILADGIKKAGNYWNMEDAVIEVKGMEPAGYEPRGLKAMALAYAVSTRGATHLSSTAYAREMKGMARDFELSFADDLNINRYSIINKALLVYNMMNFNTIADCFIYCRFLNRDLLTWEDYSKSYYFLTGIELTQSNLEDIANRITTISKQFNIKRGLTRADDRLPKRCLTEPLGKGNSTGAIITQVELDTMIDHYYDLRGWDIQGYPSEMTLERLGLKNI